MSATTASSNAGSEKKQRGGRKTKSDWRKKIDLTDVEEGLEERRDEERKGGAPITQQQDTDLFVVDIAGDAKTKTRLKSKKKLRIDEILDTRSKVPVTAIGTKMNEERKKRMHEKQRLHVLRKIAGFNGKQRIAPQKLKAASTPGAYDVWNVQPSADKQQQQQKKTGLNASKKTVESRKKLLHLAATSALEVAHPGASYRPEKSQHKELIDKAGYEYASILRTNEKYSQFKDFSGVSRAGGDDECMRTIVQEMALVSANGEDDAESDSGSESGSDVDGESGSEKPKKKKAAKRKTRVQRNREKRRTQEDVERIANKKQKELGKQVALSVRIKDAVEKEAEMAEENAKRRRKMAEEKALKPREQIGKHKVPKLLEDVKLTEELPSSLRQLQPEGNSFAASFNSLLKRNLIDPEVASRNKKKASTTRYKMTEKWTFKDFQ
ncbi:hypothetical protein H4R99_004392 [Coemansia sp. RSA 1722]|nr:hypothetical protein LPJ57_004844 [Coemansia sp. RSA 486]KAJ2232147.1 hypothetical protein IWW45_005182 [Coemansia sp. RSA 485]KAJ2597735.1 hypothetical protein H4R99_004392 [Coemansia sp. RSA 1722]